MSVRIREKKPVLVFIQQHNAIQKMFMIDSVEMFGFPNDRAVKILYKVK